MFALGHKRTIDPVHVMSDLLPTADTRRCRLNACYGPIAESVLRFWGPRAGPPHRSCQSPGAAAPVTTSWGQFWAELLTVGCKVELLISWRGVGRGRAARGAVG